MKIQPPHNQRVKMTRNTYESFYSNLQQAFYLVVRKGFSAKMTAKFSRIGKTCTFACSHGIFSTVGGRTVCFCILM
jgi:hypothetical protein